MLSPFFFSFPVDFDQFYVVAKPFMLFLILEYRVFEMNRNPLNSCYDVS